MRVGYVSFANDAFTAGLERDIGLADRIASVIKKCLFLFRDISIALGFMEMYASWCYVLAVRSELTNSAHHRKKRCD